MNDVRLNAAATEIPVGDVVFRADLYPRIETSAETVQRYTETIGQLPPIEVNQHNELIGAITSAENTEVGAVQFALQTTAITAPAPAAQPEPAAVTLTFWQKLLKLFGLYKG